MRITKRRICRGVLMFALCSSFCFFPAKSTSAASSNKLDPYAGIEYETIQQPTDIDFFDYVKDLTMLTKSEQQQLIDEQIAAQPIYDRIAKLDTQIENITNQIVKKGNHLFEERSQIFDKYEELWGKLWDNLNDKQKKLNDYNEIINASTVLSKKEKVALIKAQTRLDVIESGIDRYYEKASKATSNLSKQREKAVNELVELYSKTSHIWAKVYGK